MNRCSIIACARWENDYIYEWLAYHAAIGFDHVFLYCNDDDPTLFINEVHRYLQQHAGFITFKHFPGQGQQHAMYLDAVRVAREQSTWLTFLDIDEFLVLRDLNDINVFVGQHGADVDSISFNWLNFGNAGLVERNLNPVLTTYTKRGRSVHGNTKHLTRAIELNPKRLEASSVPFWHALTGPLWTGLRRVNSLGQPLSDSVPNEAQSESLINAAVINHYMLKSEQDFLLRAARGVQGDFQGQAVWQQEYDNGNYRSILRALNEVEDRYLATLAVKLGLADREVTMASPTLSTHPQAPLRRVHVKHRLWIDDIILGINGRAQHAGHGSLGDYIASEDVLLVKWDDWPGDLFLETEGVFVARELIARPLINLHAEQSLDFGGRHVALRGVLVEVPQCEHLVEIRPRSSDGSVFAAVFHAGEYDMLGLAGPINTVVDLGANTGLAAVFFATQFPMARVIAVEPESANYQVMCRNVRAFPNVQPVHAAIWSIDTSLTLQTVDPSGAKMEAWAYQTKEAAPSNAAQQVPALSMMTLIQRYGVGSIDLLKVDIEGAEHELFGSGSLSWLSVVRNIVIETHERFRPGSDVNVTAALAAGFDERPMRGENRVFVRRHSGAG